MRVLSLVLCLLFIPGVSLAERPEKSSPPPQANSVEKGAEEAQAEVPSTEQPKEEEKKPEVKPPEEKKEKKREKWIKVEGGDFAFKVNLLQGSYAFVTQFEGEMTNNAGLDYSIVKFIFSMYDSRGRLLAEEAFHIIDFRDGQTKTFKGTTVDGFKDIASVKIRFKSGVAAAR